MTPASVSRNDRILKKNPGRRKQPYGKTGKSDHPGNDTPSSDPDQRAACILINGKGSCPEWEDILPHYPMIDSVQREDFPEHGASFTYLAHFYRTKDTAGESARAQEQFMEFFRTIGYEYDYSGNFESRWFEGIGVRTV